MRVDIALGLRAKTFEININRFNMRIKSPDRLVIRRNALFSPKFVVNGEIRLGRADALVERINFGPSAQRLRSSGTMSANALAAAR